MKATSSLFMCWGPYLQLSAFPYSPYSFLILTPAERVFNDGRSVVSISKQMVFLYFYNTVLSYELCVCMWVCLCGWVSGWVVGWVVCKCGCLWVKDVYELKGYNSPGNWESYPPKTFIVKTSGKYLRNSHKMFFLVVLSCQYL